MPYLPITDGQGNLLPSRTVIDVTSCAQLWPNNFDVGWALVERAYAGDQGAVAQLRNWHGQKLWASSGLGHCRVGTPGGAGTAGAVLSHLLRLIQHQPGLASVNRAIHLMANAPPGWYGPEVQDPPLAGVIKRHWGKFKNASHLAFAHASYMDELYYSQNKEPVRLFTRPQLENILARAELLRNAAENIQLPRATRTILDSKRTWRAPTDLELPDPTVWLPDFTEAELAVLRSYRADQTS